VKVSQSIRINSSKEKIFNYLMDVDNRKSYIPMLEEVIMLDPLPIKEGSRYTEVAEIAGQRLKTTYQVIELIPNQRTSAKTIKSIFPIQADLDLIETGSATELQITLNFTLRGIFKLGAGIVQGIVKKQAGDILEKIKSNIEAL